MQDKKICLHRCIAILMSRELRIKTGVVTRTLKDLDSYRREVADVRSKVDEVRASSDRSKLKQWVI